MSMWVFVDETSGFVDEMHVDRNYEKTGLITCEKVIHPVSYNRNANSITC